MEFGAAGFTIVGVLVALVIYQKQKSDNFLRDEQKKNLCRESILQELKILKEILADNVKSSLDQVRLLRVLIGNLEESKRTKDRVSVQADFQKSFLLTIKFVTIHSAMNSGIFFEFEKKFREDLLSIVFEVERLIHLFNRLRTVTTVSDEVVNNDLAIHTLSTWVDDVSDLDAKIKAILLSQNYK